MSLSARRAWIEIEGRSETGISCKSLSARRAWIEIPYRVETAGEAAVALRKESVDRNYNNGAALARPTKVALRKESVDRNDVRRTTSARPSSRSPQGERG